MRIERDGRKEQYTYADLRELATRAAGFLAGEGIKQGDRVMLVSSNAPEWGMSYFGVLKTGATCIPCDPESSTNEILNFARAGNAAGMICSEAVLNEHPDLRGVVREHQADAPRHGGHRHAWSFPIFRLGAYGPIGWFPTSLLRHRRR